MLANALEINTRFQDPEGQAYDNYELGKVYMQLANYSRAMEYLNQSLQLSLLIQSRILIQDNLQALARLHHTLQDYATALDFSERYKVYHDSLFNTNSQAEIARLTTLYESQQRDQQLGLLKAEEEYHKNTERSRRIIYYFLAGGGFLLIVLIGFFFTSNQAKKKANLMLDKVNRKMEEQNQQLQDRNHELTESEAQLLRVSATKDKFFSIISHDLRSPLNSFAGMLNILIKFTEGLTKDELVDLTKKLDTSVRRLSDLLDNLLQWSKSQMGNLKNNPENLRLIHEVEKSTDLLTMNAENKNIRVITNIDASLHVFIDPGMLNFIIRNLLSNAIKFTHTGGSVTLDGRRVNDQKALFCVTDTGVGMEEEKLEKLFKIDQHFTTQGTAKEVGTGLGLLLCKEFVEMNECEIGVETELGKGSRFLVTLPLSGHSH